MHPATTATAAGSVGVGCILLVRAKTGKAHVVVYDFGWHTRIVVIDVHVKHVVVKERGCIREGGRRDFTIWGGPVRGGWDLPPATDTAIF
jgi:hypothetical protein